MSHRNISILAVAALSVFLGACANHQVPPQVSISPNHSGIESKKIRPHGPEDGFMQKLPAGVEVTVIHKRPQNDSEARYFISSSDSLKILDISHPDEYSNIGEKLVNDWKSLLDPRTPLVDHIRLSEIPWINAGRIFNAKMKKHRFPWGNAIFFLSSYAQGGHGGPVNNEELVLVVQGITHDGRYAVHGHFSITHPKLPDTANSPRGERGKVYFSFDDNPKGAEKWLNSQPDHSFQPAIGQYEEFLSSLVIRHPGS